MSELSSGLPGPVASTSSIAPSALAVERRRAADLRYDPENARAHGKKNLAAIRASLERFGQRVPLLVRPDGLVLSGNGTLSQLREMGVEHVDVVVFDGADDDARALAIAMNRTAELAEWDDGALAKALASMSGELAMAAGFVGPSLAKAMRAIGVGAVVEDEAPEVQERAVSRPGDTWILPGSAPAPHRLRTGSATDFEDVRASLDGVVPQLMVTDPPYGVEYDPAWRAEAGVNKNKKKLGVVLNDDRADWGDAWRQFRGDVAYVYHGALRSAEVQRSLEASGFAIRAQVIWAKDRMALSRGDYHWQHEPCWYAVRKGAPGGGLRNDDRSQTTLWEIPARDDDGHGHGTQKPVECMARPMRNHVVETVYDPFMGSGTTLIAAEQLGKRCFGLELSPHYVDVAVRRWQAFTGRAATLEGDGRTFDEVAAARAAEVGGGAS